MPGLQGSVIADGFIRDEQGRRSTWRRLGLLHAFADVLPTASARRVWRRPKYCRYHRAPSRKRTNFSQMQSSLRQSPRLHVVAEQVISADLPPGVCSLERVQSIRVKADGGWHLRIGLNRADRTPRFSGCNLLWCGAWLIEAQSMVSRCCSALEAPMAVSTCLISSGGGRTAGMPRPRIASSRHHP